MKRIFVYFSVSIFITLMSVIMAFGQVSLTTTGVAVTENFDGLGTANFNLTDNTSITGVYAFRTTGNATPNVFTAENGSTTTAEFKNYGTTAASDRALGSLAAGGTGTMYYGVRFVNNTGYTITFLRVTYTGEQWREVDTMDHTLTFSYRQAATVTDLTTGTYTNVTALDFTSPQSNSNNALDGNAAANRETLTTVITVSIPPGEEIMLRWTDVDNGGATDQGFGIDDLSVTPLAPSPVSFNTVSTAVTENFDGLGTTNFDLYSGASIRGIYSLRQTGNAVPNVFTADTGTSTTGQLKNYGSTGASDRALGSLASGTPNDMWYGVRYVNNTGLTITSLEVTYTGEQWRDSNTADQTLVFSYRQAATVTDLSTGTYTNVPALNFTSPVSTNSGQLNGNLPANRTTLTTTITVSIPNGEEIMLRWFDDNDGGNDHGFAIDDLSVTPIAPTAAGVSIGGRVLNADGNGVSKTIVTLIDFQGNTRTAITNPFGYYRFDDVEVGQTYTLTATSKQYQFTPQIVTINDNITELNFTALP